MQEMTEYGFDTQASIEYHIKRYPKIFKYYTKKENSFNYTINVAGFRSNWEFWNNKENRNKEVNIYLGCSHTFGIGHDIDKMWVEKCNKGITEDGDTVDTMNLGQPGQGIENSYFALRTYISQFKVKNIFHFQNAYARYGYYEIRSSREYRVHHLTQKAGLNSFCIHPSIYFNNPPWKKAEIEELLPYTKYYIKNVLSNPLYIDYNHDMFVNAIAGLAKKHEIPYFHLHKHPATDGSFFRNVQWEDKKDGPRITKVTNQDIVANFTPARDGVHFTQEEQAAIGERFIEMKKYSPNGFIQPGLPPIDEKFFKKFLRL